MTMCGAYFIAFTINLQIFRSVVQVRWVLSQLFWSHLGPLYRIFCIFAAIFDCSKQSLFTENGVEIMLLVSTLHMSSSFGKTYIELFNGPFAKFTSRFFILLSIWILRFCRNSMEAEFCFPSIWPGARKCPFGEIILGEHQKQSITHVMSSIPICWHSISNCDMHLLQCFSARLNHPLLSFFSLALAVGLRWFLLWYGFSLVLYAFQ